MTIKQAMKIAELETKLISAEQWNDLPLDIYELAHLASKHTSIAIAYDQLLGWCIIDFNHKSLIHCERIDQWETI